MEREDRMREEREREERKRQIEEEEEQERLRLSREQLGRENLSRQPTLVLSPRVSTRDDSALHCFGLTLSRAPSSVPSVLMAQR